MHDLLAPIVAVILAAIALLGSALCGYGIVAYARRRDLVMLQRARAYAAGVVRGGELGLNAAYVAGWRPARVAVAVEVVSASGAPREARDTPVAGSGVAGTTMRCGPPDGAEPLSLADPFAELDDPPSGVHPRHGTTMLPPPPFQAPLRLPVLRPRPVRRAEQLEHGEDTPTTPKDPRSP